MSDSSVEQGAEVQRTTDLDGEFQANLGLTRAVLAGSGTTVGFFGATPIVQPSVAAVTTLAELLVVLENLGLVHS